MINSRGLDSKLLLRNNVGCLRPKPVTALSGGEKNRLALAKLLVSDPDLLVLDEPTNFLDLPTTQWLEGFLRAARPAVLVVSHDRYFLDRVAERIRNDARDLLN